jgi:hypothetical protein
LSNRTRADQKFKLVDTNVWHVEHRPARAQPRSIARGQRSERWRSRRAMAHPIARWSAGSDSASHCENLLLGPVRLVLKGPAVLPAPGPVARLGLPAQAGGRGGMQSLRWIGADWTLWRASVRNGGACARLSQSYTTKLLLLAMSFRSDKSD